jgi:hypothetical protein
MSAVNSGGISDVGLTTSFQFLDYSRDRNKDDSGNTLAVVGQHAVLMFLSTVAVASPKFLGGFQVAASVTLPIASNNLTTEVAGNVSGGTGFADTYVIPAILGWSGKWVALRVMYGFLAPTGRFSAGANDNVGSGYWTHTLSAGQTVYLLKNQRLALSAFEMYEFHTTQSGTVAQPGQTLDIDYSLMAAVVAEEDVRLQLGVVGYEQIQTTASLAPTASDSRYWVNAIGGAINVTLPKRQVSLGLRVYDELANRSTFEGYSVQIAGAITF